MADEKTRGKDALKAVEYDEAPPKVIGTLMAGEFRAPPISPRSSSGNHAQGKIPPALLFHSDARSSRVCLKMQHRQSKNVKNVDGGPFGWNYELDGKVPGK